MVVAILRNLALAICTSILSMRPMKRFSLLLSAALAWFALAGCGDDPVIVEPEPSQKTDVGIVIVPVPTPEPELKPKKPPPPLPEMVLEPPYSGYLKEAVDYAELHYGKREEGKRVDPLALVFSSGSDAALYFRKYEQVPFTGWVKVWNDDGGLVELTHFKKGQEDGLGLLWHDNGFLKEQGYFTDGYEEGEWVFWNRDGNETKRETYDKGIRVEE